MNKQYITSDISSLYMTVLFIKTIMLLEYSPRGVLFPSLCLSNSVVYCVFQLRTQGTFLIPRLSSSGNGVKATPAQPRVLTNEKKTGGHDKPLTGYRLVLGKTRSKEATTGSSVSSST